MGKLVESPKDRFHLNKIQKQAKLTIVLEVRMVGTFGVVVFLRGHEEGFWLLIIVCLDLGAGCEYLHFVKNCWVLNFKNYVCQEKPI